VADPAAATAIEDNVGAVVVVVVVAGESFFSHIPKKAEQKMNTDNIAVSSTAFLGFSLFIGLSFAMLLSRRGQ